MNRLVAPLVLAAGVLLAPAVPAHPELQGQIERLNEQLRADPENVELLIRRGDLHRRHEDYDAASRDLTAARALAAGHPLLDFHQGRLALETGEYQAAAGLLDRHLEARPDDPVAWRLRGEAALALGEGSAAEGFERAIDSSGQPSPELYRQWVLAHLANDDTAGALNAVDAGIDRLGPEVSLLGLGTDIALAAGDGGRAKAYLDRLPKGLKRLAPWPDRQRAAACLAAPPPGAQSHGPEPCSKEARERLQRI